MEAMWDCASQLRMPGRSCVCGWASVSPFLPRYSATLQFQVLMSMQMDAYLKKEQIGTLFVWVGAPEGGVGGWVVGQGGPAQKLGVPVQNNFQPPPAAML